MTPFSRNTHRQDAGIAVKRVNRKYDPERWSTADQAAGLFLLGLIYALLLLWLALGLAAGGHGPAFCFATCRLGLLLWPAAGLALAFAHRPVGRWISPAITLAQYLLSLDIIYARRDQDAASLAKVWSAAPSVVMAFAAIFLTGQAALWLMYAVKRSELRNGPSKGRVTLAGAMMAIAIVSLLVAIIAIPARWVIMSYES